MGAFDKEKAMLLTILGISQRRQLFYLFFVHPLDLPMPYR
jgi:hypothetical protein